jgi:hypothetical protein
MDAFAGRFGFRFQAHAVGDANRSGRVERPFHFIENNFFAGRTFSDWDDLNRQARSWCDRVNSTYKKHLRAVPRELFAIERTRLKPLPAWIPEVYRLHERIVDVDGYVSVHSSRYSVPADWIGRRVEVRETPGKIEISLDARRSVSHRRAAEGLFLRVTLPEHRPSRTERVRPAGPHPDQQAILETAPELKSYIDALQRRGARHWTPALRHLRRMLREYPRQPVLSAIEDAHRYGLYDLDRLERMILRRIAHEYFLLDPSKGNPDEDE